MSGFLLTAGFILGSQAAPQDQVSLEEKLLATIPKDVHPYRPVFSPEGRRVAYLADWGEKQGPEFDWIRDPVFSPDGKQVAYTAREGGEWFVVLGDRKMKGSESPDPAFSLDGKAIAYFVWEDKKPWVVAGDTKREAPGRPRRLRFSPDGKTVAYRAGVQDGKKQVVVVGTTVTEEFEWASDPVFSPDGKKVAFGAWKGRELWWKVLGVK